jgi:8-oxo-dGTP pyrophosphatase MutT (NUDIX family)
MKPISTTANAFGGLVVETVDIPADPDLFGTALTVSISSWRDAGAKVVWLELPLRLAALVPIAATAGFEYHSVSDDALRMTLRLVEGAYVPPAATHYIGAGGVVIRDGSELLVVSERYRRSGGRHLKLPGGALHPGEHIIDAVRREILEETGVETTFRSLVCFRHWHGYRHGKSDIYFVCRLDPVTFDLVRQEDEIEECLWIPVDEYLASPEIHAFNRRVVQAALENDGLAVEELAGYGTPETHEIFMPTGHPASTIRSRS